MRVEEPEIRSEFSVVPSSESSAGSRRPSRSPAARRTLMLVAALAAGCFAQGVSADEIDRVVDLLAIRKGSAVADVGAGDGRWSAKLAEAVGSSGRVFATEVTRKKVEAIEKRAAREQLDQVEAFLGDQDDIGLPADCCDAVLVRMVYHHFQRPDTMRASLKRAMRPGALILLIDTEPQKSWGDVDGELDRGGHGVPIDELAREMTSDGFDLVERIEKWSGPDGNPYALLFRWPGNAGVTSGR